MWRWLENGTARIEHVLSYRGNGHAVLRVQSLGYVDSIEAYFRPERMFKREFTYSPKMIRQKLAGKTVKKPADQRKLIAAVVLLLAAIGIAFADGSIAF